LTFEDKAPLIVVLRGIDPVILGRLFAWLGLVGVVVVVVVVPVVVFLEAVFAPCANTPELTVAVKSIAAAKAIAPYISSFLLVAFVLFVVIVIAISR
jgi:hypothetical protein